MTAIARLAALDSRVESFVRDNPDCKLGDIAHSPGVAEMANYSQVVISVERLHALGRITRVGVPKNRRYSVPAELARMTSVTEREPRMGDTVWALEGSTIWRGFYSMKVEEFNTPAVYWVEGKRASSISRDAGRLVAEIEKEEK